eukprot:Phypoly_transcript_00102.p1 GENE.Phypoly_transcript_00102~~Phypoly_transcript_00102.p1  ORF type:complete len:2164 (+),score=408.47 Phypoly_transcript_00102:294-6785(+)
MEGQPAYAGNTTGNTSRRSGLRATKRIDYSTLEGGALDEEEPSTPSASARRASNKDKEGVSPEQGKGKKGSSMAKKRRLSSGELSSPPVQRVREEQEEEEEDDDVDWDDEDANRPKRSRKLSASNQSLDLKGKKGGRPKNKIVLRSQSMSSTFPTSSPWTNTDSSSISDLPSSTARTSSRAATRSYPNYTEESESLDAEYYGSDEEEVNNTELGNEYEKEEEFGDPNKTYDDGDYEELGNTGQDPESGGGDSVYAVYGETKSIEKILARRELDRYKGNASEPNHYEYLVKWKNLSYLHCSYVSAEFIGGERMGKSRLQKFIQKISQQDEDEREPFNPDYTEVDRILDQQRSPVDNSIQYLVKWKSLGYNELSWESQEEIRDDAKVAQFFQVNKVPTASKFPSSLPNVLPGAPASRPPPESWVPLKESPIYKGENTLRPYQLEGLNWLVFCWYQRRNSILADEMGLGKTVQAVSTLNHLFTVNNLRGPFLVVAPLSTIPHWKKEFEGWTEMNTIVYHGNSEARNMIRQHEFFYRDAKDKIIPRFYKFNVLITTFEMIMQDRSVLQPIDWTALVVDEAHRLKNKNSRLITELRTFKFSHLILLTGTPLQNNTEELWTLLNFLAPAQFSSLNEFLVDFGDLKESEQVEKLHAVLRPYLLRRMKENVEKSIAPKEETIVEVELTTLQKKYYRAIYERNFTFLKKGNKSSNMPSLLNVMMELRKCCNHPYLIKGVEQNETEHLTSREQIYHKLIEASGKMVLIDKLLPKLKAGGHKVLIFSQMVRVLDILEDYMVWKGYTHERLDGRIRGNDRQAAIDRFSKPDSDRFVFLLCTRAGGLGINLTAADTVIIFDSDWNPQNDVQAQARCHRIGQEKSVKVYRLITRNTYEKRMFERASKKLGLDQAVLTKMNAGSSATSSAADDSAAVPADPVLDKKVIDSLLKYGAYDLFREDDTAANRFYEEDIDRILERATVVKSTPDAEAPDNPLSSFSKASFVSNSAAPELDINDPDFWTKLLPQAADAPNPNIQVQPRVRRQVHRFGALDADDSDLSASEDEGEVALQSSDDDEKLYGQKEKGWMLGERARFKLGLMTLGYGRWQEIKNMARITRWSAHEIAMYGKAFLSKVVLFAEIEDPKVIELIQNNPTAQTPTKPTDTDVLDVPPVTPTEEPATGHGEVNQAETAAEDAELPPPPAPPSSDTVEPAPETSSVSFERDPSLCDAKFQEYLQKNAKQIIRRLETLANLRDLVQSNFAAMDEIEVPESPAPWWGEEEDRSLLLGTHKHGFGRYDEIRSDPSLCFAGRDVRGPKEETTTLPPDQAPTTESSAPQGLDSTLDSADIKTEPMVQLEPSTKTDPTNKIEPVSQTKSPVKMEAPIQTESHIKAESLIKTESPIKTEPGSGTKLTVNGDNVDTKEYVAPLQQEMSEESKASVNTHQEPKSLISTQESKPPASTPPAGDTDYSSGGLVWPSSKILSHRVKRILRSLDTVKRQQEKDTKKEQKVRERERKEEEKLKKKQELAAEWTKREKQDFYRALVTYGCPLDKSGEYHWGVIKEKANLKRKTADLIERYYVDFLTQCRNMISNNTPKGDRRRGRGRPEDDESMSLRGDDITFGQCKRVVQRIMMFSNLRTKVLPHEKLDKHLKRAGRFVSLPKWWVPGAHDKALLIGIDRHGFGSWEEIVLDPSLPFYQLLPNPPNPPNKKLRKDDPTNTSPIPTPSTPTSDLTSNPPTESPNQSSGTRGDQFSRDPEGEDDREEQRYSKEEDKEMAGNDRGGDRDQNDIDDEDDDEDEDDDMGDSDKEDFAMAGKVGALGVMHKPEPGKRKRRNQSHADSIGFPKDKVVLKRVDTLINLVLNPPMEHQPHTAFDNSARRKQTSIGDFTNGKEKFVQASGKEKGPGRPTRGSGRGRGGRGRGRGRGASQGITHSSHPHNQAVPMHSSSHGSQHVATHNMGKEEPKQKSHISEFMLSDDAREDKHLQDVDDSSNNNNTNMFEKHTYSPPHNNNNTKYSTHHSGPPPPYMNDHPVVERYSYTRSNIFNNDHESDDDSTPMPSQHTLPHAHPHAPPHPHPHLPQLQFDPLPHSKLQNTLPLPHEHSYAPNFPPLSQSYRPFHYDNSKMIENDSSTFIFDRQSPHKKLPVQLPPLFPPPPQLPPNFPHDHPFKQSVFNNSR